MLKNNKLSCRIETRIDEIKYKELQGLLQQSRYRNMSELLRDIVYNKQIRVVTYDKGLDMVMQQLSTIRSELHAIGININQVTKFFNSVSNVSIKTYHALNIAGQYKNVGDKTDTLFQLISKLSEKWLQK